MAKQKTCVKCGRSIDEVARVCPYCNWWQSEPVPAQAAAPPPSDDVPPTDTRARNKLLGMVGFAVLLLVLFIIGAYVHGSDEAKGAQSKELAAKNAPAAAAQESPRATVTLVPVTEGTAPGAVGAPITAIAGNGSMSTAGPGDVTALPSGQYDAETARQRAAQQQQVSGAVDPRSITGAPYTAATPRSPRPQRQVARLDSQPVPIYQPVPRVRVGRQETAQFYVTVGTDGRVHDIDVQRSVPEAMGPLVSSMQQWRYRP